MRPDERGSTMADRNIPNIDADAAFQQKVDLLVERLRETLTEARLKPTGGPDGALAVVALLELAAQIIATAPADADRELAQSGRKCSSAWSRNIGIGAAPEIAISAGEKR
ncbi:MAG: hypothetical protein JO081_17145 [Alphaproteobacteria bacterium]|nr:hypothetical protein [Alphaproteobacteria bacterium]